MIEKGLMSITPSFTSKTIVLTMNQRKMTKCLALVLCEAAREMGIERRPAAAAATARVADADALAEAAAETVGQKKVE